MDDLIIRDIALPADETVAVSFIGALQRFEHGFEPNRRIDSAVAAEYWAVLLERVTKNRGRIFLAERDGHVAGWGVFVVEQGPIFVVEPQRAHGYIAELYVIERARGRGIGRALIAACEEEARKLGLSVITIGVLAGNRRAAETYARAGFAPYSSELRKYL